MEDLKEVLMEHQDEYLQHLKDLIAIDTHDLGHGIDGGLEKKGQEYMERLFASMGADEVKEDPLNEETIVKCLELHKEGNLHHKYDDRYNVYATFKGNGGKSLLFNGHIDVMPADEVDEWTTPPFDPVIRDGKLYGRGTSDMKSGLMASVMAVKLLKDAGYELPGDVIITSVCDEEGGGNGSMQAVMSGCKADGVVNCEPTDRELKLAHMGWVFFKVDFTGLACHSGGKMNGVSAIEKAIKVINELNEMEHRWLFIYKHRLLPPPNLNVGVIQGGSAGSTVAGDCSFSTCIHYIPGIMSHEQVVADFMDVIDRMCAADPWLKNHRPTVSLYQAGQGFEMEENSPFVDAFKAAHVEATDEDVAVKGSMCGTDARLFKNIAGCPTVIYGPGGLAQCHAVDEYCLVEDYYRAILVYAELILKWCGQK